MSRVQAFFSPEDVASNQPSGLREEVEALFARLFPGVENPAFDEHHTGMAIAALNPALAGALASTSGLVAGELDWSKRRDLRELAIQAVNVHFKSTYSFNSRLSIGEGAGVPREMQEALADWKSNDLFSAEQRLVIEYAQAVAAGAVPEPLFRRVVESYGERGAVECTAVVAFFAFWALFLNATEPS